VVGQLARCELRSIVRRLSELSGEYHDLEIRATIMHHIKVIDSHTGGEPTRIIIEGGPDLGTGPLNERLAVFRNHFDEIRSAVVNEPRGSDVLVGGLLCEPLSDGCSAGIIFFNNTGFLGMCGHGTIGLMVTLKHLGSIDSGRHRIDTPVGVVTADVADNGEVTLQNVPSYRLHADVTVDVPDYGAVTGDVAWGGNWFFLVQESSEQLVVDNTDHLTRVTIRIRDALLDQGITGTDGAWIDHVELFGPPVAATNNSRNFVLCPGGAYDRSPCGTGTSAKLACLAADGKLNEGEVWRQESIVGSVFSGSYVNVEPAGHVVSTIVGSAHICGEATLILNPDDPFCMGIRS
jgi:4-hydroxyproline epimerase